MQTTTSRRRSIPSRQSGYTLVEIMLVLSIIAVLVGAGIYYLAGNLDVAKYQTVENDIQTITTQLKTYEMINLFMPTTEQGLDALVNKPTRDPVPERWHQLFEKVPVDPWGMPYKYVYPGKHNPNKFDLYSTGPDRVENANEIGNWQAGK